MLLGAQFQTMDDLPTMNPTIILSYPVEDVNSDSQRRIAVDMIVSIFTAGTQTTEEPADSGSENPGEQ